MSGLSMASALPFPSGSPALAPELARSLVDLLESARKDLDHDRDAARGWIARASSLLRVAIDGVAQGDDRGVKSGALAAWQINRVRAYIDAHLDQPIHIKDLAAVAQRSAAYFCRAFKRTLDETPHSFVIERRLAHACHLMLTSDLVLSEIALNCGLTDQAHLCKLFRQKHAQSPAAWRRERRALSIDPIHLPLPDVDEDEFFGAASVDGPSARSSLALDGQRVSA